MRNILTAYDDTMIAMAEIEGYGWLDRQLDDALALRFPTTVPSALLALETTRKNIQESIAEGLATPDDFQLVIADVYGSGGWNRWYVCASGEVRFSIHHSSRETCRKVEELGFRLF